MKTYSENPSFSNQKNLEETEQLLDEVYTVRDFLKIHSPEVMFTESSPLSTLLPTDHSQTGSSWGNLLQTLHIVVRVGGKTQDFSPIHWQHYKMERQGMPIWTTYVDYAKSYIQGWLEPPG